MLLSLAVLGGFALYVMNAGERERLRRPLRRGHVLALSGAAAVLDTMVAFLRALRAGKRWAQAVFAALLVVATATVLGVTLIHPPQDIAADVAQMAEIEAHTTRTYAAAAAQFRLGTVTATTLAQLIERRIRPELHVVRMRLLTVESVRPEQASMLASAREYLRLRDESWRERAAALARRDLPALRRVELTERAALAALDAAVRPGTP